MTWCNTCHDPASVVGSGVRSRCDRLALVPRVVNSIDKYHGGDVAAHHVSLVVAGWVSRPPVTAWQRHPGANPHGNCICNVVAICDRDRGPSSAPCCTRRSPAGLAGAWLAAKRIAESAGALAAAGRLHPHPGAQRRCECGVGSALGWICPTVTAPRPAQDTRSAAVSGLSSPTGASVAALSALSACLGSAESGRPARDCGVSECGHAAIPRVQQFKNGSFR